MISWTGTSLALAFETEADQVLWAENTLVSTPQSWRVSLVHLEIVSLETGLCGKKIKKINIVEREGIQEWGGKLIKLWKRENNKIVEMGIKKLRREINKIVEEEGNKNEKGDG